MSCWLPTVTATAVGVPGVVIGVAETMLEPGPVPAPLTALTWNQYVTPLVSPVTDVDSTDAVVVVCVVHVTPPSVEV